MSEQLALFEPDAPATRGVTFVQVCHQCSEPVSAVPLDDVSDPWMQPVLWCYVAQKAHERERHPDPEGATT